MNTFLEKLKAIFVDPAIRKRIIFVLAILLLFRLIAAIPIPNIDKTQLENFFTNNQFFGLLGVFSGGGLYTLSIVMLGVAPYITASIIMQLLTMMFPSLKALYQEEGELGRKKFNQYSRLLTVPLALLQAFAYIILFQRQGVMPHLTTIELVTDMLVITAGSVLLMWLGELISEFGIGSGVSIIIFAGIVARLPQNLGQLYATFDPSQIPTYLLFIIGAALIVYGVVYITEAERPVPVTYAKRVRGNKIYGGTSTYLPLRLNQAGVIPIIFALSLLLFPQMIFKFFQASTLTWLSSISTAILNFLNNQWFYGILYFVLVFLFTYFYTAVTFDPEAISSNLQKSGAFIPGVRPGGSTSDHLSRILTRITLVGALFLGIIAILPLIAKGFTGNASLAIGGTALLIVITVVLDLIKKVDAQVSMREY
jgi:preprotein translocase subunit SecY